MLKYVLFSIIGFLAGVGIATIKVRYNSHYGYSVREEV
jgi:hypothetical protein